MISNSQRVEHSQTPFTSLDFQATIRKLRFPSGYQRRNTGFAPTCKSSLSNAKVVSFEGRGGGILVVLCGGWGTGQPDCAVTEALSEITLCFYLPLRRLEALARDLPRTSGTRNAVQAQGWTTDGLIHFVPPTGTVVNSLSILRFACIHPPASGNASLVGLRRGPTCGEEAWCPFVSGLTTKRSITMRTAVCHHRSADHRASAPTPFYRFWLTL